MLVDSIERMVEIGAVHNLPKAFEGAEKHWYRGLAYLDDCVIPVINPAGFLTKEEFARLDLVAKSAEIPILRKDFIVDPWQVWETRAAGADAFLLIAAVLEDDNFRELLDLGRSLKMEPLVEVHSREELDRVLAAGAKIIGINNRDLRDFSVRVETSLDLIDTIPDDCIAVSESGLHSHEVLLRLRNSGFDAFLIGEHLMTSPYPAAALKRLLDPDSRAYGEE